jgi:hypothetical protein
MPRSEPRVNLIATAVLNTMKKISREKDASSWLTTPRTFQRGLVISAFDKPRPALFVAIDQVEDTQPFVGSMHESRLRLLVHLITDLNDNADEELNRLAADVYNAIAANETLVTPDYPDGLVTWCFTRGHGPHPEASEKTGFAVATVVLEATYQWIHGSP